jgi:glycine/D-amino acid oxidase-like deaminating enzyme
MSGMADHLPVWMRSSAPLETGPLREDLEADVCIVGCGIAGLSTAYLLSRGGYSVVVLDSGPLGGGETGRTTAHLSNALDDRYYELERLHGASSAKDAAESHTAAIDCIESIIARERIECDFQRLDGFLFVARASHKTNWNGSWPPRLVPGCAAWSLSSEHPSRGLKPDAACVFRARRNSIRCAIWMGL